MTTVEQGGHRARTRLRAVLVSVGSGAAWVTAHAPGPLRWFLVNPRRIMLLGWLVALMIAGHTEMAYADSIINGPDLAHGAPKTLFEQYGPLDYSVTVKPDEQNSDSLEIEQSLLELVGVIDDILLWIGLALLAGGLVLLEWMLNLTIYRDSAGQLDGAVQMIAAQVFWPMIAATTAVGATMAYARWRADGRGFAAEIGWVVAAVTLAAAFASGPSEVMNTVDSARQDMGNAVISGASQYIHTQANVTGYPTPTIDTSTQSGSTRELVDGLWNSYGATPWCWIEFGSLSVCHTAGYHALANDSTWQGWMQVLDSNGAVPEFGQQGDWIRGQSIQRTGDALILLVLDLPVALLLLMLVLAGLRAAVGFLFLLTIGVVFLVTWPIPGFFRTLGTRYFSYCLGFELQALFITVTTSGVMVTSAILGAQAGKYGFFLLAVLNILVLATAVKARSWLEMVTTGQGAGTMGLAGLLMARAAVGTVAKLAGGAISGGAGLLVGGMRAASPAARRGAGGISMQAARNWASLRDWKGRGGASRLADLGGKPLHTQASQFSPFRPESPKPALGPGREPWAWGSGSPPPPASVSTPQPKALPRDPVVAPGSTIDEPQRRIWVSYHGGRRVRMAPLESPPPRSGSMSAEPPRAARRGSGHVITTLPRRGWRRRR